MIERTYPLKNGIRTGFPNDQTRDLFFSHFAKVYFGLNKTIIASAHGSTAFDAKSKAADRAMFVLSSRNSKEEVNKIERHHVFGTNPFVLALTNEREGTHVSIIIRSTLSTSS